MTTPVLRTTPPREGNDHPGASHHPSTGGELEEGFAHNPVATCLLKQF